MDGCAAAGTLRSACSLHEPMARQIWDGAGTGPPPPGLPFHQVSARGAGSPPCWHQVKSAAGGCKLPREAFGLGLEHRAGHLVHGPSRCPCVWLLSRGPERMCYTAAPACRVTAAPKRFLRPRPLPAAFLALAARGADGRATGGGQGGDVWGRWLPLLGPGCPAGSCHLPALRGH